MDVVDVTVADTVLTIVTGTCTNFSKLGQLGPISKSCFFFTIFQKGVKNIFHPFFKKG